MYKQIVLACLVAAVVATVEDVADVEMVDQDQDVAEWNGRGYYGRHHGAVSNYNPYGYSSPSNKGYFGPGYVVGHHRGRRSAPTNVKSTAAATLTSYNPYGYSSPSNSQYYGPGYVIEQHKRGRRSADDIEETVGDVDDQTANENNYRGWRYNHGYYHGYPHYYRSYGHYYPKSHSYSYRSY